MRYLEISEKLLILSDWERTCAETRSGRGFPDQRMLEWCQKINALPGVCTIQSCSGHHEPGGAYTSGHLWLRLSRRSARRFNNRAFALAGEPGIERVSRFYASWGEEVAEIVFLGDERGHLAASMLAITNFLATQCSCQPSLWPCIRYRVRRWSASWGLTRSQWSASWNSFCTSATYRFHASFGIPWALPPAEKDGTGSPKLQPPVPTGVK